MLTQILPSEPSRLALILGGRSWVGYRLSEQLLAVGWSVLCTTSSDLGNQLKGLHGLQVTDSAACNYIRVEAAIAISELIKDKQPAVIINLRIGISEEDYEVNQAAAIQAEKIGANYVYVSSALALDGYQNEVLVESLPPRAVSEYGIFKGRCENYLRQRTELQLLILRFSSIHGWSPWKDTRTVALLKKVAANEIIRVNRGIVQNRCSDIKLAETVVSLVMKAATGVAHIGTCDKSEELDFLKQLARAFGYSSDNIIADAECSVNLAVISELGIHPKGFITQADTISELLAMRHLENYKRC